MLTTKYGEQQKEELRVALATTHLPLRDVPGMITKKLLTEVIEILHHSLQKQFGISHPSITICGLNPHAGEGGILAMKRLESFNPLSNSSRKKG